MDAKLDAEWTSIRGVRELRDGRVIVLDSRDYARKLVDFKTSSATMIGGLARGAAAICVRIRFSRIV